MILAGFLKKNKLFKYAYIVFILTTGMGPLRWKYFDGGNSLYSRKQMCFYKLQLLTVQTTIIQKYAN